MERPVEYRVVLAVFLLVTGIFSSAVGSVVANLPMGYETFNNPPVASFVQSATTAQAGDPVNFDASSSFDIDGKVVSYTWDFGDGTILTVTVPAISHAYGPALCPTEYTITLTVSDEGGTTSLPATSTITIFSVTRPLPFLTLRPGFFEASVGEPVTFEAEILSCSPPFDYVWDFGDETGAFTVRTFSASDVQTHVYRIPGTFVVTVTVFETGTQFPISVSATGTIVRPVLEILIDIKPGSDPNSVNVKLNGLIPVAVLSTSDFGASSVDPLSVRFGRTGLEAVPVRSGLEDVDRDGDLDLILQFKVEDTGIQAGDTEARLTGSTFDGSMITGSDMVRAFFPGDVNGDLVVDVLDLALLGASFGSVSGSPNWNPYADFDENGIINVLDLVIVGRYFGQHS